MNPRRLALVFFPDAALQSTSYNTNRGFWVIPLLTTVRRMRFTMGGRIRSLRRHDAFQRMFLFKVVCQRQATC